MAGSCPFLWCFPTSTARPSPPGTLVFETFEDVKSVGAAVIDAFSGDVEQFFSGTIALTSLPPGTAPPGLVKNYLTATFTKAVFDGSMKLPRPCMLSAPESSVSLPITSTSGPNTGIALSFSGIAPTVSTTDNSVASFTAQEHWYLQRRSMPEPSILSLASISVVIAVIVAGGRKMRAERERCKSRALLGFRAHRPGYPATRRAFRALLAFL